MSASISGIGGAALPAMVSGASPMSSPATKMTNLFQTIDAAGTGSISRQQFNNAFTTLNPPGRFQSLGASSIFSQLDPLGTGSVSKSAFVNGMTSLFNSSGASSTSGTPTQSLSQSQQLLDQLGSQTSPGMIYNKLI